MSIAIPNSRFRIAGLPLPAGYDCARIACRVEWAAAAGHIGHPGGDDSMNLSARMRALARQQSTERLPLAAARRCG
jgi:hypothetical protein